MKKYPFGIPVKSAEKNLHKKHIWKNTWSPPTDKEVNEIILLFIAKHQYSVYANIKGISAQNFYYSQVSHYWLSSHFNESNTKKTLIIYSHCDYLRVAPVYRRSGSVMTQQPARGPACPVVWLSWQHTGSHHCQISGLRGSDSLLRPHWFRNIIVLLRQHSYAIKNQLKASKVLS